MIEPYEVTRSSVFVTTDPEEQYSSVTVVEGENDPQTSDASSTANTQASVKNKVSFCILPCSQSEEDCIIV